jgi:hypothetical protein
MVQFLALMWIEIFGGLLVITSFNPESQHPRTIASLGISLMLAGVLV